METPSSCQISYAPRPELPFLSRPCVPRKSAHVYKSTLGSYTQAMVFPRLFHLAAQCNYSSPSQQDNQRELHLYPWFNVNEIVGEMTIVQLDVENKART